MKTKSTGGSCENFYWLSLCMPWKYWFLVFLQNFCSPLGPSSAILIVELVLLPAAILWPNFLALPYLLIFLAQLYFWWGHQPFCVRQNGLKILCRYIGKIPISCIDSKPLVWLSSHKLVTWCAPMRWQLTCPVAFMRYLLQIISCSTAEECFHIVSPADVTCCPCFFTWSCPMFSNRAVSVILLTHWLPFNKLGI